MYSRVLFLATYHLQPQPLSSRRRSVFLDGETNSRKKMEFLLPMNFLATQKLNVWFLACEFVLQGLLERSKTKEKGTSIELALSLVPFLVASSTNLEDPTTYKRSKFFWTTLALPTMLMLSATKSHQRFSS